MTVFLSAEPKAASSACNDMLSWVCHQLYGGFYLPCVFLSSLDRCSPIGLQCSTFSFRAKCISSVIANAFWRISCALLHAWQGAYSASKVTNVPAVGVCTLTDLVLSMVKARCSDGAHQIWCHQATPLVLQHVICAKGLLVSLKKKVKNMQTKIIICSRIAPCFKAGGGKIFLLLNLKG